jgi:hypothetical protein
MSDLTINIPVFWDSGVMNPVFQLSWSFKRFPNFETLIKVNELPTTILKTKHDVSSRNVRMNNSYLFVQQMQRHQTIDSESEAQEKALPRACTTQIFAKF